MQARRRARGPRVAVAAVAIALASALAPGCSAAAVFTILPASGEVHAAEAAGAAEWAPYEYWSAHEYLEKAAEEANQGNYYDAYRFAERARDLGHQARELAVERRSASTTSASTSGGESAP